MRNLFLMFGLFFWVGSSFFSYAKAGGHVVGNGGGVVECRSGTLKTYETLDLYEARVLRRLPILVNAEESAKEIALWQSLIIYGYDINFGTLLRDYIEEFDADANIIAELAFEPSDDFGDIILQENCSLRQAVIQVIPKYPNDKRYFIKEEIWTKLDNVSQAAIILHEVIYRILLAEGQIDSQNARYAVGELLSHNCNSLSYDASNRCWSTESFSEMKSAIGLSLFKDRPE